MCLNSPSTLCVLDCWSQRCSVPPLSGICRCWIRIELYRVQHSWTDELPYLAKMSVEGVWLRHTDWVWPTV